MFFFFYNYFNNKRSSNNKVLFYNKKNCSINRSINLGFFPKSDVNYFSSSKLFKDNLNNNEDQKILKIDNNVSINVESLIDKYENVNIEARKRIERMYNDSVWAKIAVWNCQRLNKIQTNERFIKLEFIRDCLNENRFDFVFLVDVDDKNNVINLNGFKKYVEGRNCLFVKDNITNSFLESKNILYVPDSKLAFVYITPNINDKTYKNNIFWLLENEFVLVGEFNIKSNKWLYPWIIKFNGEDSLQSGFLNPKSIRSTFSLAAPSDHHFVSAYLKINLYHSLNLKTKEISVDRTFLNINDICNGLVPKFEPKIIVNRGFVNLNDRENTINFMIADFLNNNARKIYKKYNYLWSGNKREPFLGTKVPEELIKKMILNQLTKK